MIKDILVAERAFVIQYLLTFISSYQSTLITSASGGEHFKLLLYL